MLFTDTDSLWYHIKTDDVYFFIYRERDLFDNSDYVKSSKFFFDENKKVIGKFKDEAAGNPVTGFAGLKGKMYSYETEIKIEPDSKSESSAQVTEPEIKTEIKNNKTAKGVKKNVIHSDLDHSDYLETLLGSKIMHHSMKSIRSDNHQMSSYHLNKISLSCYDDKRYILDDGITSLAYGWRGLPALGAFGTGPKSQLKKIDK